MRYYCATLVVFAVVLGCMYPEQTARFFAIALMVAMVGGLVGYAVGYLLYALSGNKDAEESA